ncbi:hypothetical protein [Alcaligenes faecalis]|uniref:hypothetical protein n=1 Tax=Alcaligenes faecalis TaxID=511 RepID=UPI001EEFECBD|nr:hypothetical protein [Alcaligenes faecalis]ULH08596.1 hypothetical protein MF263_09140 [Alcaligenes faecalis]
MLHRNRFELALERLDATNWARFEQFASAFLTKDFPNIRTVASPGGDGGRDAELYSPENEPTVVLQYSVTPNWKQKIRNTAKRVSTTLPNTQELIYVTNQVIGAKADEIRREIRKECKLYLDIRDRSYFLDRYASDAMLEAEAARLSREIVDPYLESKEIIERKAQALSEGESRAALVFLEMQWEDDTRDKGLTRLAFDGLVRTVLRGTTSEIRLSKASILKAVCSILPGQEEAFIRKEAEKAISRLTKRYIRAYPNDEYCLTHEEAERIKSRLAETEVRDIALGTAIGETLSQVFTDEELARFPCTDMARKSIEQFLLQRGELFVSALERGQLDRLSYDLVKDISKEVWIAETTQRNETLDAKLSEAVEKILTAPSIAIRDYLKSLADAYTLLAFLKQTPDVQSAVQKMFSHGEIWLDTSIVLPLIAEDLVDNERQQFRQLIAVARTTGLKLKITDGVLEEVETHTHRSSVCANSKQGEWKSASIPYLFSYYVSMGRGVQGFTAWLTKFRGNTQPAQDIADFLQHFFGIERQDITQDANRLEERFRTGIKEAWINVHMERRQRYGDVIDPNLTLRLAEHDTENYAGVLYRRKQEGASALGFTSWWLTLDHRAFSINKTIANNLGERSFPSPAMSADFLTNYLAFGPLRDKASKSGVKILPVALDASITDLTPELIEIAKRTRENSMDQEEYVIQRQVRDALDMARRRTGRVTERGLQTPEQD